MTEPGHITLDVTPDEAERLSLGLSDLLCWCAGFKASLSSDERDRAPLGIEDAREINIVLKRALRRAAGASS